MKKVAIVGSGIAGMACAKELHPHFDITVFEKNSRIGGHTHTIDVEVDGQQIFVDMAFMVFNEVTYPHFTKLLRKLEVQTQDAPMSFSVQNIPRKIEYSGTGFKGLFAQKKNILSLRHWKFLMEISRFNRICSEVLGDSSFDTLSVKDYCQRRGFSSDFLELFLLPMSSAVWSAPQSTMLEFSIVNLVRFFSNHRFLSLNGQLAWQSIVGGSQNYRDRLIAPFKDRIFSNCSITSIESLEKSVRVTSQSGERFEFDAVVLATHANEALSVLQNPTAQQIDLLSKFSYQTNSATLHTDESKMAKSKHAWTSWNYRIDENGVSTVYWVNNLQKIPTSRNLFISINRSEDVPEQKVLGRFEYSHPIFDVQAWKAQRSLQELNQTSNIFFCGSYFKYGFHEDALVSGFGAADAVKERCR